ncbi:MAG: DUF1178 family protein [Deltaproteobacteria bacterium]|jgi:hypothetical protein|nr:DUF1178 family protein [Deltaproteobacteria bacterium]
MIVFDLTCSQGHIFEGWFDSNESFEEQNTKDLVRCPVCEDSDIQKVLSPVAVKKSQPVAPTEQETIDYQRLAKEVVEYIKNNSEDVGAQFAAEALKIHYGVTEKRSIRGSATAEEEKTLQEEGVEFVKVPFPVTDDDKTN